MQEAETIAAFWRQNVAAPPYRFTSLVSFLRILALPLPPLKEFVELMAMSAQDKPAHERVTLCLSHSVGSKPRDAVVHMASASEIYFVLRFVYHPDAGSPASSHAHTPPISSLSMSTASVLAHHPGVTAEMGLRYQYTTHMLRVWGGVSAEEDAAHTDLLERAIGRARIAEPDSGSGGMLPTPTLPAVVRALLFLRNAAVP